MEIDRTLAETIAQMAMREPFRQIRVMTTEQWSTWLGQRGIRMPWQSIHYLWSKGVLHPIAVLDSAVSAEINVGSRFAEIDANLSYQTFIDLGKTVTAFDFRDFLSRDLSSKLARSVLWHPFQFWLFYEIDQILSLRYDAAFPLYGLDVVVDSVRWSVERVPQALATFAQRPEQQEFLQLLALLLAVEPLVHLDVYHSVQLSPTIPSQDPLEAYVSWLHAQDGAGMLDQADLTLEQVERWHKRYAAEARWIDPLEGFRVLLQHAKRSELERLEGSALRALELYDVALVLRRYVQRYHDRLLPEEDHLLLSYKQQIYGTDRPGDFERAVFRRIARDFGLDPQARTAWFVEGDTELFFVSRLASQWGFDLNHEGINVRNLMGKDRLGTRAFRELLEHLRNDEVFAFVSADRDSKAVAKHLSEIRKLSADKLLPVGFRIWDPDFETANFSLAELAEVANQLAADHGSTLDLTDELIRQYMVDRDIPAGKAIESLSRKAHAEIGKGRVWGDALADWAAAHATPIELADENGRRPVIAVLDFLRTGKRSNYKFTVENTSIDESGNIRDVPGAR